jgi:hypothetical protein
MKHHVAQLDSLYDTTCGLRHNMVSTAFPYNIENTWASGSRKISIIANKKKIKITYNIISYRASGIIIRAFLYDYNYLDYKFKSDE